MATINDKNRFSVPVEALVRQVLREQAPKLNVGAGSAVHDILITPASLLFQRFRDQTRVIQRNQSLANYAGMLPEELDRLAANFLVDRRQGEKATGSQRIVFATTQAVEVTTNVVFTDDAGRRFRPISRQTFSSAAVAANTIASTGEFFVDVNTIAEDVGDEYLAAAGAVTGVTGVPGALRTFNPLAYFGAANPEGNAELFARIKTSVTNRDLVKAVAIESAILAQFPTVKRVSVQGFGDPLMTRDVAQIALADQPLFSQSFCQKVNLPLDADGNVQWTDTNGDPITAPVGGFVGAVYDLLGLNYNALQVTQDGVTFEQVSVQQNFRLRLLNEDDPDFVNNDYKIARVEEVPVAPGGDPVKVARIDRPFKDTSTVNVATNLADNPYQLFGFYNTNQFHIGGKVDVYVESSAVTPAEVVISSLPPASTDADVDVSEVPLTSTFVNSAGVNLFEDGTGFQEPVQAIVRVEQVDAVDEDIVIRELEPDTHYALVRQEVRGRFTTATSDVLRIYGSEPVLDGLGNVLAEIPMFIGTRIKVTYLTSPDIPLIEAFLDNADNRDITKDIQVKTPVTVILDVELTFSGDATLQSVRDIITEYINGKPFGEAVTVNELVTVLALFNVQDVTMPVTLRSRYDTGAGSFVFAESEDRLALDPGQVWAADTDLSITKV